MAYITSGKFDIMSMFLETIEETLLTKNMTPENLKSNVCHDYGRRPIYEFYTNLVYDL